MYIVEATTPSNLSALALAPDAAAPLYYLGSAAGGSWSADRAAAATYPAQDEATVDLGLADPVGWRIAQRAQVVPA